MIENGRGFTPRKATRSITLDRNYSPVKWLHNKTTCDKFDTTVSKNEVNRSKFLKRLTKKQAAKRTMFLNHEYVAKDGRKYRNGIQYWPPRDVKFTANTFGNKLAEKWCIDVTTELKEEDPEEEGAPGTGTPKPKAKNPLALGALGALQGMLKKPKITSPAPVDYD